MTPEEEKKVARRREYMRVYRERNRERINERRRKYYQENKEYIKKYHRIYNKKNREKIQERQARYWAQKLKEWGWADHGY